MGIEDAGNEINTKLVPTKENCIDFMFVGKPWKDLLNRQGDGNPVFDVPDEELVEDYLKENGLPIDGCRVKKTGRGETQAVGVARLECDDSMIPLKINDELGD